MVTLQTPHSYPASAAAAQSEQGPKQAAESVCSLSKTARTKAGADWICPTGSGLLTPSSEGSSALRLLPD